MTSAASGIVAALSAPFLLDVGFVIWDKHWKGSSFDLHAGVDRLSHVELRHSTARCNCYAS